MQLYGNRLWNDVTDNRHKAYFVMQDDIFRAVTERLDAEGLNYYAFEQNGTYKMAVNEHDLRYFRDVIGDRLIEQMDRTSTTRSNAPQTIIGTTEYRGIQNKRYFTSDIDMVLKIAEHLQQQNVPFSGRVYDDHATITVSAEHEAAVLEVNNRVLAERQQHRHAVSQHMVVSSVPYQDIQQPYHFSSHIKPQEFMQVKPILDAAEIPYSGIVKNNGIILTVDQRNAQQFGILLNAAQTKRQSIDELKEAGFSDHQIALMDPALDRFAEANDYESITSFVDPRFADEQILYITDAAARYIVQSEADRLFDRSGILLDMIHYRDAALRQIEFDEAFRDTAYSPEQRQALQSLCDTGITPSTLRESLDESYSVEEMQRLGVCFRDSDVDGLRKIQEQHTAALALVGFDPEPDDLAQTVYMRETEAEMQRDVPAGAWQEIAASEEAAEEPAATGDTFQIYRLKEDQNELRIRFENYDTLEQMGFVISADKYDNIYTGALEGENATLNGIYETFNINHPADFNGYSLSVGDIIVTIRDGERTAHMVDSIGFRELPDFFMERQEPQQDAADRQPDLFDLPHSDRDKQIIGNTPFRYIAGKTYHKLDTETAKQIAQEFAAQEIKFSGRIKGDTTTLTIPAESEEQYQEIAARFLVPEVPEIPEQPEEPARDAAPGQPLELHIGDHIRMADDPQNAWIVTEVSDFILKLENADQKALASAQMMTGWQKHLDSSNVTILPEKGLPAPAPPKKRSAHLRKQAEGQLALFGEPEPTAPDRRRELLLNEVGRGTGFENGKLRVYDCIHDKQATAAELADFLKKEFGIGGHSGPDMPDVSHDSKGIVIIDTDKKEYRYSWSEAAKAVTELDRQGQYLTAEDIEEAIESSKYYLNEVEHLDDVSRTYHENMLARLENHPLRNGRAAEPEQTAPEMPEPAEEAPAVPEPVEVARTSDGLIRFMLCKQREPAETPWNAQRWSRNSTDEDFSYNGFGRFAATEQEARAFIANQFNRYENRECADAIREAVNRNYHYEESHFDSAQALKEVQEQYPTDRIALLLAAEVQNADWDGRYSGDVRDWSRKELKLHDAEEIRLASEIRSYPHPGLMNMLAQEVMEQQNARAIEEPEIAEPQAAESAPAAEQPVKIRNTMEHRIFLRMRDLYPEVIKDAPTAHNYEHYENPNEGTGYEPFAIQRLTDWNNGQCLVSMMHTYEQNGDHFRDPDIVLRVDLTQQTATAISYQQDGLGIYREYPDGSYGQRDTNRFMLTWLKNLRDQHREITHAEVEYTHEGTQYSIDLNYEGGELREVLCDGHPEVERAFAKEIGRQMDELDAAADAARTETPSDRAVRLINAYTQTEFQQDADYSDMSHVDLAAVNDKESGLPIEVYADLESYQIIRTLGGTVISEQQYDSLDDMCENALEYLDFNSLTDIDDSEREKAQQPDRLALSPAARFLMNAENMQSFVDRLIAGDKMNEIASRILDHGKNAAEIAQEYIDDGRTIFSDHETFDDTEYSVSKTAEDVTFTAEPDSERPFSVTYSWEQVGAFVQQAAQLQREVNREAEQAWEREVAESIEETDPEAMAVRAQEIERTIQMTQRRIDNYDPAIHTPEKLQEWKDMLDYLQSDTPDNIELTSEGLQAFLEKRNQQNRAEAQQRFPEMLFTGTLDGFNAVMIAARTDAFSDVGTASIFGGETVVTAVLTDKAALADVQSLIRTAAENGCYLTPGAVDQLKERFGENFMPDLPLNGTFQIPQSGRHLDITAVRSFTMTNTYSEYEGGMDSSGHERMDNYSRRSESITYAYQGGGIVESQHYSGSEYQQYPDIEVYNIYDPVQRERMIADMQQFADQSDYLNTDIEPIAETERNYVLFLNDHGQTVQFGEVFDTLEDAQDAGNLAIHNGEALGYAVLNKQEQKVEVYDSDFPMNDVFSEEVYANSPFQTLTVPTDAPFRAAEKTDFTIGEDFTVAAGKKGKFQANMDAIRTLKTVEAENRAATPEEQKILAGYVGWGGIPEAFDSDKEDWASEYTELRSVLTDEEYAAARASTENAHYTQPMIISEMYRALEQFGFSGGRVLEPSMGTGNFFGTMPEAMRSSSELYGVELDSVSGRIAKQLYPSADIEVTGFEHTHFNNNAFDVVVGNVPFGNYRVMDAAYDDQKFKIHDYFLAKSVDKLKEGGIMACVTSSGTMDKMDASARMYLAERAELIGAVRLPNNAFRANAGADVTTDILFFQKREEPLGDKPYPEWTMLSETENGLRINSYFKEHPEMVLGTLEKSTNPFSSGVECVPVPGADLRQQLSEALGRLSAEINREPVDMDVRSVQFTDDAPLKTYFMREGNLYFKDSADKPAEISELSGKKRDRVIGMIGIRDAARAVVQAQTENCSDEELHKLQAVLNERYDTFYKKNGLIHSKANATVFREDDGFALICSLEKDFDLKKGTLENKADIFTKRTICQFSEVEHADTAEDALIVSMQYRGRIDFPYMEQLCGKSRQEMISDLGDKIFPVPDLAHPDRVSYQPADEYLSGNIRQKLDEARVAASQNPMFERNIPALEKVLPPKLRAGDIKVRLGATWIKPEYIRQFMYETLETPRYYQAKDRGYGGYRGNMINVEYVPEAGLWHVSNPTSDTSIKATRDFGTKDLTAYEILDDVLNLRAPKVYMTVPDPGSERGEKRVLDGEATSLAQKKAAALQQAFENWVFKDPERAADLVETYNDKFNSMRPREYDGSHLIFPGMAADIKLREHQRNAIAHALYGGNALFAHCVGAGKTYEMIATAMEGKRLGMHHKSLFVVPKHLTSQIGEDFLRLYPSANILVATTKDFKASNRRELMARIATGNYDAVIISHDQFKALPLSAERATRQMQQEVDTLTDSIDRERVLSGGRSFTVKALERQRRALQQQIEKLVTAAKKDQQNVTFEQLGIDHIFVDEAHEFKNLLCPTKLQNLTGISNSASQKAMDLFLKCRYLDEETGSRGVTLATGTPISNSITEIHTMLRYLAHDTLEEHGLAAFDAFISTFGAPKTDWELSPTGTTWRQKTRMAGFDNMPELQSLWRAAADVQTAETLNLPTPDCEMHIVEAKPTQLQQELMQELSDRADEVQAGGIDNHYDNNLLITGDGRKVGLDPRLVDPTLEDNPNTKLNLCVDNVFRIWSETAEKRSTQLIFCDLGVPHKKQQQKADAPETEMTDQEMTQDADDDVSIAELFSLEEELPFCVYDDIKDKLVARGVPAEEIAFIHEAKTETQKSALFEKVRNGDVRVLIGSTPKMGTGTNVQDKLIALHDLDIPWRPADLEQRRGRMVRQGNENDKVHLFRYVTTGTFDAVSYQTLEAKQKFIGQVMTNQAVGRSCEDIDQSALSYAQIKAACTGDTRFKEKMQLETDVQTLRLQRTEHLNTQDEMREKVARLPDQIQAAEQKLMLIRKDYDSVSVLPRDDQGIQFSIDINGETLTDKTEAAKRVAAYFSAAAKNPGEDIMVGNFCGFPLSINCQMNHIFATLHGQTTHTAELSMSTGYIVRGLQDIVNGIGRKLQKQTREIAEMKVDLQQAQERADQPFPLEAELTQKADRLATLSDALRKEAMARMKDGGKQGRQTFYFDRNRRNELRNAAKQAGQKPQEKQNSKDAPIVE